MYAFYYCRYSRRVLWLQVLVSNNSPQIVATQFLHYLREINGAPRCVRMDCGTENTLVEDMQKAFRWDHTDDMAGEKSVIKGSSHSNQRIERWWRSGRQGGFQYWITLFADMESNGILSTADPLQIEVMRFCFWNLLQEDLDKVRIDWNQHSIRESNGVASPGGKPDLLYHMPNLFGSVDYKVNINSTDLDEVTNMYAVQRWKGCNQEIESDLIQKRIQKPGNVEEALALYNQVLQILSSP